ncbi:MAG TPA: hypothetical protein VH120_11825 [Gemmataceae bacterium]|jgi:hypothetical protein|nr:hypothetical protein [Gemmataceae bacterium]
MSAARIICPGCGAALASAAAFQPGKLADCPKCRLLFAPTADDLANPRGRAEEIAAERAWAEADVPRPYPKSTPYTWHRRFRGLTLQEIGVVMLACGLMMALAGVVVSIYMLWISGTGRPPMTTAPPAAPPSATSGDTPTPPAASTTEVEDDRAPPRKPVPTVDDDPP